MQVPCILCTLLYMKILNQLLQLQIFLMCLFGWRGAELRLMTSRSICTLLDKMKAVIDCLYNKNK
jgi:hypothetical protein